MHTCVTGQPPSQGRVGGQSTSGHWDCHEAVCGHGLKYNMVNMRQYYTVRIPLQGK